MSGMPVIPLSDKVLYVILPWGMGHAARSIPLIKQLLEKGITVFLLSYEAIVRFVIRRIPTYKHHNVKIPCYIEFGKVRYSNYASLTFLRTGFYAVKTLFYSWGLSGELSRIIKREKINMVVSDGFPVRGIPVPVYLINHQINFVFRIGGRWRKLEYPDYVMGDAHRIIVPDYPMREKLAGLLSETTNKKVIYAGPMTRFGNGAYLGDTGNVSVIISGPEPFHGNVLNFFIRNCERMPSRKITIFTHGKTGEREVAVRGNVKIVFGPSDEEMAESLSESEIIISTAGYSSIMDICVFRTARLVIPTPGQPEQEYLAYHLTKEGFCSSLKLKNFNYDYDKKEWEKIFDMARVGTTWHPPYPSNDLIL